MMDQGNLRKPKPRKTQKPNKKETTIERGNPLESEIPEWLQEFRENMFRSFYLDGWSVPRRALGNARF